MNVVKALLDVANKIDESHNSPIIVRKLGAIMLKGYVSIGTLLFLADNSTREKIFTAISFLWDSLTSLPREIVTNIFVVWAAVNLVLYVAISILVSYKIIRSSNEKYLSDPETDVLATKLLWIISAIWKGPAYCNEWVKDLFAFDFIVSPTNRTTWTSSEKSIAIKRLLRLLDTYLDMRYGFLSNTLTLKVYLLGALSVILWGLYPFTRALKKSITTIATTILQNPGVRQELQIELE